MKIEELTQEDITNIENMWEARQKGLYYQSSVVTELYNRLLSKKEPNSNCGSCIRKRIDAIHTEYERIKNITTPTDNAE